MTTEKPIAVLGAGAWGSALAILLARNNQVVRLWARNQKLLETLHQERQNARSLPNITFPSSLNISFDLKEAVSHHADILIAVPSHAFLELLLKLKPYMTPETRVVWATKGLDAKSGRFLHQLFEEHYPNHAYAVIAGPSFAKEVAEGLPTAVTIASNDMQFAHDLKARLSNEYFRVYLSQDLIGVQLGGIIKNILAVAVGLSDGLGYGANARAALMTRGLSEMMRLGEAMGAKKETLMGLSGCGDVILTCTDNQSRNRRFGLALAEGQTFSQAQQHIGQVVEAVYNVAQVCHLAQHYQVEMPIATEVHRILKQEVAPREAVQFLLARKSNIE